MNTKSEYNHNATAGIQHKPAAKVEAMLLLMLISIFVACATEATYFQRSNDIAAKFEKGRVLEGYRYYIGGPAAKPNAIAALKDAYNLESEHWTLFTATPDALKKMVGRVKHVVGADIKEQQMISNGARIMDDRGNQIGIWYSVYEYSQVRLLDGHRVYLSFPPARLPIDVRGTRAHFDK